MSESTTTATTTTNGTTPSKPIDVDAGADVEVTGEKRKAPPTATASKTDKNQDGGPKEEVGGKDKVEKKQTTLDDVVQHEKADDTEAVTHEAEKKEEKGDDEAKDEEREEGRPAKKTKIVADIVDEEKEAAEDKATPPAQLSQPSAVAETPHKTVKKVDDIADKPVEATPTKSAGAGSGSGSVEAAVKASNGAAAAPDKTDANANGTGNGGDDTVPGDEAHLDHPENWTTGGDPATDKQKGFLKVLEKQKGVPIGDVSGIGKSEASEKIDELKNM